MQTSAHPPSATSARRPYASPAGAPPAPRASRPAPFPTLPAPGHPAYWLVVYQQALLAMDAMHALLFPPDPSAWPVGAVRHGLYAALHDLKAEARLAVEQLQYQGRLLMAVPAKGQA